MQSAFRPQPIDRLFEVDPANCEYQRELVEIDGVVSPSGQGGWPRTNDYSVHCFSFAAWRQVGKSNRNQTLTLLRPVAKDGDWFSEFPAFSLHRVRVLLSTDETRAIFAGEEKLTSEDIELLAIAAELQKPALISTSRFGDLTLDRSVDWYEGRVEWNGEQIKISFETDVDKSITEGLATAEKLWLAQADWKQKVEAFATQVLLPLKNDNWLDEGENPLTTEQFKSRMTLESIQINRGGKFEFWHNDGDLFWGHSIQVSGSLKDGLESARIPG
jgi:hypothetical protein